jgi:hypothetical protein
VCAFPGKDQFTHAEAKRRVDELNRFAFDGRPVHAYRCPSGGHWHVGHWRPAAQRARRRR